VGSQAQLPVAGWRIALIRVFRLRLLPTPGDKHPDNSSILTSALALTTVVQGSILEGSTGCGEAKRL
jgi:hypothetical protein